MISFKEFLELESNAYLSEESVDEARKQYKRYYHKMYKRKHRKQKKQTTITFTKEEAQKFEAGMRHFNISLASAVKLCALAYLKQEFVLPKNVSADLKSIIMLLRKQGTLLNQIAKKVNINDEAFVNDILNALSTLKQQEEFIDNFLRHPPVKNDNKDIHA